MKKNIKNYFVIIFLIIFSSCSTKTVDKTNLINKKNIDFQDSIPYDLWYVSLTLVSESEVIQIERIDSEERKLNSKTKTIRDSIIKSIDLNKLPTMSNADSLLKEAIKTGNLAMYCTFTVNNGLLNFELYPYSMYMGEIYKFTPAYDDVFYYFYKLNYILQKNQKVYDEFEYSLNELNENQQNLALYSLIKSYKNGYIDNAKVLAYYFREGLYFPKDIQTANKLDSIYEYRSVIRR